MAKAEQQSAMKFCSKCGVHPRADVDSSNPWCLECKAAYQAEYRASLDWRAERRGLIRGIQAMREEIARYFRQWSGARPFMGPEVAQIVEGLPGPAIAEETGPAIAEEKAQTP